jgi:hypothetical protein
MPSFDPFAAPGIARGGDEGADLRAHTREEVRAARKHVEVLTADGMVRART